MEIDQAELLKNISAFLDKNKIPYMLTGALSVVYYGRPRASHDIDFVVEIQKNEVKRILRAFKTLQTEYLLQLETIEEAIKTKGMFNIVYLPTYLKLDFWLLTDDPFDKERFKRRQRVKLLDQFMTISTPEDTIIQKLRWYKEAKIEKHLVDAAFVYQIQKKGLDQKHLKDWIKKLKLTRLFQQLHKIDLEKYL